MCVCLPRRKTQPHEVRRSLIFDVVRPCSASPCRPFDSSIPSMAWTLDWAATEIDPGDLHVQVRSDAERCDADATSATTGTIPRTLNSKFARCCALITLRSICVKNSPLVTRFKRARVEGLRLDKALRETYLRCFWPRTGR